MNESKAMKRPKARDKRVYVLEVLLISGPVPARFAKKNPVVSRTIEIRGDRTLKDLHYVIFDAFDREDEHMYEFQLGGGGPMDPNARRYVLPMDMEEGPFSDDGEETKDLTRTTIGSLGLAVGEAFGYWFDFGDDWWHQINVVAIEEKPFGKSPRVIKRVGQSPAQYEIGRE